jgi:hypothetical protein
LKKMTNFVNIYMISFFFQWDLIVQTKNSKHNVFTFCFIQYYILLPSRSRCYETITQTTRPSLLWCPAIQCHNIRVQLDIPYISLTGGKFSQFIITR